MPAKKIGKKKNKMLKENFSLLSKINQGAFMINHSKFFSGLMMVVLNLGSKYVTIQLSDSQKNILNKYAVFRQILIFSIFWMGTKDLYTSLAMTAVFIVLSQHIFNEKSKFCLLPKRWTEIKNAMDKDNDGKLSEQEIDNAIKILQKTKYQQKNLSENNTQGNANQEFMRNRI